MFETLRGILVTSLKVPADEVTMESSVDDLDLDSLALVELSMALQSELGMEISEDELSEVETVADIVAAMQKRSVA